MLPGRIRNHTQYYRAPPDWDEKRDGPCRGLYVRQQFFNGIGFTLSAHEPTPDELTRMCNGEPIILGISTPTPPVMFMMVGDRFIQEEEN